MQACASARSRQAARVYAARHVRPERADAVAALRRRGRHVWPLRRRGADLGFVVAGAREWPDDATALARWRDARPVFLPAALGTAPAGHEKAIAACLQMFARLRRGGHFLAELERRLQDDADLRYAGSTVDRDDPREIERVFVDAERGGTVVAKDLWAKLTWIANDAHDRSLRIRFSAGLEQMADWLASPDLVAGWVDLFAARAFPECAAILTSPPLRRMLDLLLARPYRLSERILYNNAPDGGAVFHHDAEPAQLGVCFSQLEGHTAWLAICKRQLAGLLVRTGFVANQRLAMQALDGDGDERLWRRLNRDADFTAHLAAHGALFVLGPGDSIVLPSHGIDDVAWHSVVALGEKPSLAHSYGVFARRSDYPAAADPWRSRRAALRGRAFAE
jgi:hypothetical protein